MNNEVVIVGAGAAGLMAGRILAKAGKSVTILEARNRIGGRIYPLSKEEFGYEAMGGGEFVHGAAPVTKALLLEAGCTLNNMTEWWNVRDGQPQIIEPASHIDSLSTHDPVVIAKLKELTEDMPVLDFLDKYFPQESYAELRHVTLRRVEEYDAADPARASSFALLDEMTDEEGWEQQNIREGYTPMLQFLEAECLKHGAKILFTEEVRAIDFSGSAVQVLTQNGNYTASKVINTIPLPKIKDITFTPPLPEKFAAVDKAGFGGVIKMLLRFNTKWWALPEREKNFEHMFFMFSSEKIPTWWTQYPEPHLTLTGWAAGPEAAAISNLSDAELLEIGLTSLSNIFKISVEELRSYLLTSKVVNWFTDPFAKGAYSYLTPQSNEAIIELLKPEDNKLFFAGEALSQEGVNGTVEAALVTGKEVAQKILSM